MGPDADGRGRVLPVEAVETLASAALRRPQLPNQQAQERGLARTVVADHGKMLRPGQGQGQVVQNSGRAQVHIDVVKMYLKTVHSSSDINKK